MAPQGPRNNRPSAQRGVAGAPRGGGISKRRGAARVDRDGDFDMSAAPAAAGNGAGNARRNDNATEGNRRSARNKTAPRGPKAMENTKQRVARALNDGRTASGVEISTRSRRDGPVNAAHTMTIKVEGLAASKAITNSDGGVKSLLAFLERKGQSVGKLAGPAKIKKSQLKEGNVYITTVQHDGQALLRLDGYDFAGSRLRVSKVEGEPLSETTQQLKDTLTAVLQQRYDVGQKLLNLSRLGQDPILSQMSAFQETTPQKLFAAFMAICDSLFKTPQAKRDAIVSVSLAGNNIDDVTQVMPLADTFPDLVNLDLSGNMLKETKNLRKWSSRLRKLETLLLNENPIATVDPLHTREMMRWYPRLQNLNGIQVRTAEEVAEATRQNMPKPIPNMGPDFRDINGLGEGFILEFIQMYDTDRHNLVAKYYDDESTFSLSVINSRPNAVNPSWASYIKLSRNHSRITTPHGRLQRLFTGTVVIQDAWRSLPPTQHPDLRSQLDRYIIDCHPVNGLPDPTGQSPLGAAGMMMTIHGEFDDQDLETRQTTTRAFSRTILLGPGAPGRHLIRVISDMLSLRAHLPLPGVTAVTAPPASEEIKQQMVIELCKQTGMVPDYSKMCLDVANWNFDQALVTFQSKRADVPPEAFGDGTL